MNILEKFQTIIILLAVIFGLVFGQINIISTYVSYLIVPFLFFMLFGVFLGISLKDFRHSISNLKFAKITIILNFVWTPFFAYFLGAIFLNQHVDIWIGFIMLMVTPCTDWYLVFTDIAKGNLPLSASILPLNLILQLILLPIYLFLFVGVTGSFDIGILLESIIFIVILPFFLAQITRYFLDKNKKYKVAENLNEYGVIENFDKSENQNDDIRKKIFSFFNSTQIIFLSLAIFCMFASQGSHLLNNLWISLLLIVPILLFFVINFVIGRIVSKYSKFSYEDSVSLSLTTLARNSPIALAIAVTAFPDQPLIALALVIGPLIELPVLTIVSQVLLLIKKNNRIGNLN